LDLTRLTDAEHPIAVLDVDSTLQWTAGRHLRILHEFAVEHQEECPELLELSWGLSLNDIRWSVLSNLEKAGIELPDLRKRFYRFWAKRFFSGDYLVYDQPYQGAQEFVRRLIARGIHVVYLTARPAKPMGAGTVATFLKWGFPVLDGTTTLYLKPHAHEKDHEFKADACERIRALGTVVLTVENEPTNANLFQDAFPSAINVLVDTEHSPRQVELDSKVQRVSGVEALAQALAD